METIEVVFFLLFAVVCASFIVAFLTGFDFESLHDFVTDLFYPEKKPVDLKEVDFYGFAEIAFDCWSSCGFGAEDKNCLSVFLKPTDDYNVLSKEKAESFFEKINLCRDCNILMQNEISLPSIIAIKCENNSLKIQ
jgi:hypothetical protein